MTPIHMRSPRRPGFTLVEMLVAITIILILAGLTITAVNVSMQSDRIRGAARQMQSYLEGARDRAIFAQEPRGVRILLNQGGPTNGFNNAFSAISMIFVGPTPSDTGDAEIYAGKQGLVFDHSDNFPDWQTPRDRGLLRVGNRVKLGSLWFTIISFASDQDNMTTGDFPGPGDVDHNGNGTFDSFNVILDRPHENVTIGSDTMNYVMELAPSPLPNQEPVMLPQGILIDLDASQLPSRWGNATHGYSTEMDILFSPRGTVHGPLASDGIIHFALVDLIDLMQRGSSGRNFGGANVEGDELIVTVFTQTGQISRHPVFSSSDPYRYAETGEVAK